MVANSLEQVEWIRNPFPTPNNPSHLFKHIRYQRQRTPYGGERSEDSPDTNVFATKQRSLFDTYVFAKKLAKTPPIQTSSLPSSEASSDTYVFATKQRSLGNLKSESKEQGRKQEQLGNEIMYSPSLPATANQSQLIGSVHSPSLVRHQSGEQPTTLGSKYFRHLWLFATFGGEQEEMVGYLWQPILWSRWNGLEIHSLLQTIHLISSNTFATRGSEHHMVAKVANLFSLIGYLQVRHLWWRRWRRQQIIQKR